MDGYESGVKVLYRRSLDDDRMDKAFNLIAARCLYEKVGGGYTRDNERYLVFRPTLTNNIYKEDFLNFLDIVFSTKYTLENK